MSWGEKSAKHGEWIMKSLAILILTAICAIGIRAAGQEAVQNPHGSMKWECSDCHTTESWSAIKPDSNFKHDDTGFPLQGVHASVACGDCHKGMKLANVGSACVDCHTDVHQARIAICHSIGRIRKIC
jgi:hypothetical protein